MPQRTMSSDCDTMGEAGDNASAPSESANNFGPQSPPENAHAVDLQQLPLMCFPVGSLPILPPPLGVLILQPFQAIGPSFSHHWNHHAVGNLSQRGENVMPLSNNFLSPVENQISPSTLSWLQDLPTSTTSTLRQPAVSSQLALASQEAARILYNLPQQETSLQESFTMTASAATEQRQLEHMTVKQMKQRPDLFFMLPVTKVKCKCKSSHCKTIRCSCLKKGFACDPAICECGNDCINYQDSDERDNYVARNIKRMPKVAGSQDDSPNSQPVDFEATTNAGSLSAPSTGEDLGETKLIRCFRCKQGCDRDYCPCNRNNVACTDLCGCTSCRNVPSVREPSFDGRLDVDAFLLDLESATAV